jgi:hypothetical protein
MTSINDSNICTQGLEKSKNDCNFVTLNNYNNNINEEERSDFEEKYVITSFNSTYLRISL